ncbi:MAG TPA: serine/threonine-protein kinase [Kofleriaceae bacterium]
MVVAADDTLAGRTVGRYIIERLIARGGMGAVYRAHDPELGRSVAIKVIRSELQLASNELRLVRESMAMAQLAHPNVLTVYDVGRFEGQVFIAMELALGGTLREWVAKERRSWSTIVERFVRAGRGLKAAHEMGLVHRDFKPENVLLTADEDVRVADFGLVGSLDPATAPPRTTAPVRNSALHLTLTQAGAFLGTPRYMAPEQHKGEHAGVAADQFAFGVSLYEALYGEHPFPGETWSELARAVGSGALRAAPTGSDVPPSLRKIVVRALRVDPLERWPSMTALIAALEAYLARKPAAEPSDPTLRAQVSQLRRELEETSAFAESGQVAAASHRMREIANAAVELRHPPLAADALFAFGCVQHSLGDLKGAEAALGGALVEASRARDDLLGARIWNELLLVLRAAGRFADVMLLRPSTEAAFARCEDDPVMVGQYQHTLALILEAQGRWSEALPLCERAAAAFEEAYGAASPQLARAINGIAYMLQRLGRYDEARAQFERAHNLFATALGPDHVFAMFPINNLGELCLEAGDAVAALAYHERAYALRSRVLRPDHPHVALSLHNLGVTLLALGRTAEARERLERALAIRNTLGVDNVEGADSLSALGAVLIAQGKCDEGLELHTRALEISSKPGAPQHPRTIVLENQIASALVARGRTDDARAYFERALALAEAVFGPSHPHAARARAGIAHSIART